MTGGGGGTFAKPLPRVAFWKCQPFGCVSSERTDSELANSHFLSSDVLCYQKFWQFAVIKFIFTTRQNCVVALFFLFVRHFADLKNITLGAVSGGSSQHSIIGSDGSRHALHWFENCRWKLVLTCI